MGAGLKKAALPAAAVLGGLAIAAVGATKAAMEDAAAQEHLAGVLERTTGATASQIAATEEWISAQALATGVADDERSGRPWRKSRPRPATSAKRKT